MADRKSHITMTCDGKAVIQVLDEIKKLRAETIDQLDKETKKFEQMKVAGTATESELKAQEKEVQRLIKLSEAYGSMQSSAISKTAKLKDVINDLANSTDRQLKQALGNGKSLISGLTGSDKDLKRAEQIRYTMKQISDQQKLIEGEYVKMGDVLRNVGNVSDKTLSKAIKQQQDVLSWTKRSSAEYQVQLDIMKKLEAEQAKRQASARTNMTSADAHKMAATGFYRDAAGTAQRASADQMQEARKILQTYRDSLPADSKEINKINDDLAKLETRIQAVNGKIQQTSRLSRDAALKLKDILKNPSAATGNDIKNTIEILNKRLGDLPVKSKGADNLRRIIDQLQKSLKGVADEAVDVNAVLNKMAAGKASVAELKAAYKQLEQELAQVAIEDKKGIKQRREQMAELKNQIDEVTGATKKQNSAISTTIKNMVAYVGVFGALNMIKSKMTEIIQLNLKFSDQLADIRKVSGLATKDVEKLANNLAKIDTRTSVEELNQIAYAGAKLGMGKYGIDGMNQFVQAANQVNVALKEDLGQDALTALSKITEVMGLIPKMGVEQSMLATGSAMFKLSATSTATSENIVEFTKRLTGIARTAGMTTPQLLALGSAADSMMLMPEVASTAFNKLITSLQRSPGAIEQSLGISKGTIDNLFSAGKTMDAIVLILEKMKAKGNMNALDDVFKDLGSDGARLIQVMVTMSKNVDMLKGHLYTSTEAFEEAKAVTDEYNIQQQTANALMERAANTWEKMFVNSAQVTEDATFNIRAMAQRWYELSEAVSKSGTAMFGVNSVLTILSATVQGLIYAIPAMVSALVSGGVVYAIANAASLYRQLAAAMEAVKKAYIAMNLAAKTAGWAGLIMTLGTLIATIIEMRKKTDEAVVSFEKLNQYRKEAIANATEETRKLKEYINVLSDVNISQQERERLIQKFNNQYGEYIQKLGIEINTVDDLKNAYSRLNDEIKKKTISEMRDKAMSETTKPLAEESHTRYNELRDVLANRNYGAIDARYVKGLVDQGQGTEAIFKKVIEAKYGTGVTVGRGGNVAYRDANGKVQKGVLSDVYGAILNYVNAETKYNQGIATVNNEFSDLLGDWTNEEATVLGHLRDKPDPKAAAAAAREQRREWRDQLKEAEDQAKAIIDQIKNYYERQETEIIKKATELGQSEDVKKAFVEANEKRKNAALANVRKAIVGTDNDWDNYVLTIIQDLKEPLDANGQNESTKLVNAIKENNLVGLRKMIATLSKNLNKPESATMDAIWKNASLNEQANAKIDNTAQQRRQKESLEHDYTGVVEQKSMEGLFGMGFFNATQDDWRNAMSQVIPMLRQARKDIVNVLATDGDKDQLLTVLFGKDYKKVIGGDDSALKPLLDMSAEDARLFYQKLIQYSDEYTEAEKKQYEEQKKIADFRWKMNKANLDKEEQIRKTQDFQKKYGKQSSFLSNLGLADIKNDPEVQLMRLRMEAAMDYYAFIQKNSQNEQLRQEAEKKQAEAQMAYTQQLANAMRERLAQMKNLTQPIVSFGEQMGDAFAKMSDDAESAKDAINNALKAMLRSFGEMTIKSFSQQMWQGGTNAMINKTSKQAQAETNEYAISDGLTPVIAPGSDPSNPNYVYVLNQTEGSNGGNGGNSGNNGSNNTFSGFAAQQQASDRAQGDKIRSKYGNNSFAAALGSGAEAAAGGGGIGDVAGSAVMSAASAGLSAISDKKGNKKKENDQKKSNKRIEQEQKRHNKKLQAEEKKGQQSLVSLNEQGNDDMLNAKEQFGGAIIKSTQGIDKALAAEKASADQQELQQEGTKQSSKAALHSAGIFGMCVDMLGPIAGPIAFAAMEAILMGLLSFALSKIGGGGKGSSASTNTKLVSGMLTYDEGNVSQFVGTDGNVYSARNAGNLPSGVSMITSPIATTVNGSPALVAERGPEIVIGRQTTAAIMQNAPYLLSMLAQYDRNRSVQPMRLYDDGNISDMNSVSGTLPTGESGERGSDTLNQTLAALTTVLTNLQRDGVRAHINKYGKGGLVDEVQSGLAFMSKHG